MSYSIIGSGNVGEALAIQFARSGIPVGIANTRGPDSIAPLVEKLGHLIQPLSMQEAVKARIVILAVPFRAHTAVAQAAQDWAGKIVVDAMNTYGVPPDELKGMVSTEMVASAFPGAKLVKTFNQLPAKLLAKDPAEGGGRRVMFLAGDDEAATASVTGLVGDLGFAPILLGKIREGGALLGMGGALILQNLLKQG